MERKTLKAEKRSILGKKVKKLRAEGNLPGNIFGKKVESLAISVPFSDFKTIFAEAGETGLIDIEIDQKKRPVLVHSVQYDPLRGEMLHVDFHQVDLKEKISAQVPVELTGESSVEKQGLGTVVQYLNEIEVEALPTDLPESFVIDTASLTEVDQTVTVADLSVDSSKVEILEAADSIIVKVEPPQKEEVVETAPAEESPETETAAPAEDSQQQSSSEE